MSVKTIITIGLALCLLVGLLSSCDHSLPKTQRYRVKHNLSGRVLIINDVPGYHVSDLTTNNDSILEVIGIETPMPVFKTNLVVTHTIMHEAYDKEPMHLELQWELYDDSITYTDRIDPITLKGHWLNNQFIMMNDTITVTTNTITWNRPSTLGGPEQTVFK